MKKSRLERILEKLLKHKELLEAVEKGTVEINFSGDSETVQIKIVVK